MKALLLWYWKVSSPLSQRNPLKRIRSSSLNDSISLDQDSRFSVRPAPYPVFAEEARINRAWASSSSIEHLIPEFTFQFPGTRHYFESLELSYPFVLIKELSHCCCCCFWAIIIWSTRNGWCARQKTNRDIIYASPLKCIIPGLYSARPRPTTIRPARLQVQVAINDYCCLFSAAAHPPSRHHRCLCLSIVLDVVVVCETFISVS